MHTDDSLSVALATLLRELLHGPANPAYMLNSGDAGLLQSLDALRAQDASATAHKGGSIAAHVDHVRYGLELMNRWSAGEHPFESADWARSWETATVADVEWQQLRAALRTEATRWLEVVGTPRELSGEELTAMIGSIAHLAYHLGAIRQIHRATRGPSERLT
jgi:hypothetical protein